MTVPTIPTVTGLLSDLRFEMHETGPMHPETPLRNAVIAKALIKAGLTSEASPSIRALYAQYATHDDVALCHTPRYLQIAETDIRRGRATLSTGDTHVCPASLECAYLAVGGVMTAVDALFNGEIANAFCAVRPPGHHATSDRGMGFCVFNNIAIAARYAQKKYGVQRVLIADWDVHHGNGTQEIFYEDPSVLFFSTHQWPLYPGTGRASETGEGPGLGYTLNCPLPEGSRREVIDAFKRQLVPAARLFKPDLVLVSAGFDGRIDDPLGGFKLTDEDFAELTRIMLSIADEHCQGRLISVLEGGYNLNGLASAVVAHVTELKSGF